MKIIILNLTQLGETPRYIAVNTVSFTWNAYGGYFYLIRSKFLTAIIAWPATDLSFSSESRRTSSGGTHSRPF